ncbi:DUF6259 domain-containing protein [bacterium]|nr:DUF6259 domain-containing protein [bacterium]
MRKSLPFALFFLLILLGNLTFLQEGEARSLAIFDVQHTSTEKWRDTWDNGVPSGAKFEIKDGIAHIVGTEREKNYGVVYRYVDWNLDKYPFLEINVTGCTPNADWFLLIENHDLTNGYLKLQEDNHQIGKFAYNVREATGLKGVRRVRIEIGITTGERPGNIDLSMKMSGLKFVSSSRGKIIEIDSQIEMDSDVTLQTELLGWENRWKSGQSSGAFLSKQSGGKLRITGENKTKEYGSVFKELEIDFSQYSKLEVVVFELNASLYMVLEGKQFRGGYYRIKPEINKPGSYIFDFSEDLGYLKGEQKFIFTLGVTTGNPAIPVKDYRADFYSVKFIGKKNIKLVAGIIPSQLIQPPPPLVMPQAISKTNLAACFTGSKGYLDQGGIIKLFGQKYRVSKLREDKSSPEIKEDDKMITIENNCYQVVLDRATGTFQSIQDKTNKSEVSMGSEHSYLWRVMFKKGDFQNAKEFLSSRNSGFSYKWLDEKNTLKMVYRSGKSIMTFFLVFSDHNYFDLTATFQNNGRKIVTAVDIPRICLDYRKLEYLYLPYAMGVRFNQKFFKGKRQWKTTYPLLFSDFVNWSLDDGGKFSSYLLWRDQPIKPTRINIGYSPAKGECGIYEHGWATYIKPGDAWASQPLRMVVGEKIEQALKRYRHENGLDQTSRLVDKLGKSLFDKVRKGVLLKISLDMNRDFDHVASYFKELPYGTIVHYVTWWLEGFDKHMPDFWPVNPTFGTNQDFKKNIALAKKHDLVLMPYTNNTFWNVSPTLSRSGGPKAVASKNFKNEAVFEVYASGGKGWATSPRHPAVRRAGDRIAEKFFNEYKIDMLFLDQIGARFIDYDMNSSLRHPNDYAQGWYENCFENVKSGPLLTEQGYDRIVPLMSAFCGMASYTFPKSLDYNIWWGEGSWEYFPIAQYLSHENVLYYHHNLAHEVFCDSHEKITFYLAHGYNMFNGRWVSEWHDQKKWFQLADQLQKHVVSKYVGKPLLNYEQIRSHHLIWSAYPDLGILANLSELDEYPVLNHTVARNGFIATDRKGTFLAGRFTRLYGFDLGEPQYIVVQRKRNKVIVTQLEHHNTLITIPRPAKWKIAEAISVRQGRHEIPLVALTPHAIAFHTDTNMASTGAVKYVVEYNPNRHFEYALKILSNVDKVAANTQVMVGVEGKNLRKIKMDNVQLVLSAWMVKRNSPVIKPKDGFITLSPTQYMKTESVEVLKRGETISGEFPLRIPSTAEAGDVVWLKGELVSQQGKKVTTHATQSVLQVDSPFAVAVKTESKSIDSGEWTTVLVSIKNNFTEKIKGQLHLNIPDNWKGKKRKVVKLKPREEKKIALEVKPPQIQAVEKHKISASFQVRKNVTRTKVEKIEVSPVWRVISFEGPRVLVRGKKNTGQLRLITFSKKNAFGTIELKPSAGLLLSQTRFPLKVADGGEQIIRFDVTATQKGEQEIKVVFEYGKKKHTEIMKYPVIVPGEALVLRGDWMNCGDDNIIMSNEEVEVQLQSDLGGRIMAFYHRDSNANMLYQNYPTVKKIPESKDWIEYGGVNDWFPSGWPGFVWNDDWEVEVVKEKGEKIIVAMKTRTQNGLELERRMILPSAGRQLQLDYSVRNLTDVNRKYLWFNHPDLAPGPYNFAGDDHRIIIPVADPENDERTLILEEKFNAKIGKDDYEPNEGWVVALDTRSKGYFMQKFNVSQMNRIGVWQDAIFYTMELLSKEEKVKAGESKTFTIFYIVGNKNWEEDL